MGGVKRSEKVGGREDGRGEEKGRKRRGEGVVEDVKSNVSVFVMFHIFYDLVFFFMF